MVYSGVKPQDIADIVRQHLVRGQIVERLLYTKKEVAAEGAGEDDILDPPPPAGQEP